MQLTAYALFNNQVLAILLGFWLLVVAAPNYATPEGELLIDQVSFNPSTGASVRIQMGKDVTGNARLSIYDSDGGLIRTLQPGEGRVRWDGLDDDGKIVPDEAYTFVLERADGSVYDPTAFSGGEVGDITDVSFDASGSVSYKLPKPARVLIRLGISNGPMYRTLVDWKPRPGGKVNEYWDGFDKDQLVKLQGREDFSALVTYATLPDATVITYGNKQETYREYKLGRGKGRPQKPAREPKSDAGQAFRPDSVTPHAWARAPQVEMSFPEFPNADAIPTVKRNVNVRIDAAEEDKPYLMEDQFEVLLFVDGQFFAEAERGYLPLNWKWELQQFPPGEHVLTVNISSFKGQVGVASRKIIIEK